MTRNTKLQGERNRIMDVEKFFHMSGGVGDTSYAQNSSLQKKASDMVKHVTLEALRDAYLRLRPKSLGIADLGCSSGPNTLSIVKDMIDAVEEEASQPITEFRVYLNDLPSNDFNPIFRKLPDFYREYEGARKGAVGRPHLYVLACPGSFYGKLFPDESLHFVHSSYSLHWLSRVPAGLYDDEGRSINNGNIYISATSPPKVAEAYAGQFQDDFSAFLRFRSQELKSGGKIVLIFLGRKGPGHVDRGNSFLWGILSRSISELVLRGKVEQEKLNSYEVPFYAPSMDEVEREIAREGSFEMTEFEMFEQEGEEGIVGGKSYGTTVANTVRAIQAPMIANHFGDGIIDDLFMEYARLVDEEMAVEEIRPVTFHLVLTRF
ncbi:hypothetical protein MLD38_029604 [Melastoma candidum]|uniref:Uncharacterized protein n=1 Tax=Melastoma candidum TaxID=119954 RepID=A0ACB9N6R9_9MYRT|nr:hypothetical protein MLD38_029604 [Melastoma candidum]